MNADHILGADMPILMLATEISPIIGILMSLALLGIGFLAFGASFVGIITLVGTVYPITGYLGLALIIAILISWITMRREHKAE